MDPETFLTLVREITVTGLLALVIYGLLAGHVVTKQHHEEVRRILEELIRSANEPDDDPHM